MPDGLEHKLHLLARRLVLPHRLGHGRAGRQGETEGGDAYLPERAKVGLPGARFELDAEQTDAILELKIYRLAKLEILVIRQELDAKRRRHAPAIGLVADLAAVQEDRGYDYRRM